MRGREIIRVEPLSAYLERWKAPTSAVTRSGDTLYVSGFPPFDPDTGQVVEGASIERQTELAAWCGVVYGAFVVETYSRAIVGWAPSLTKHTTLVLDALDMAL